MKLKQLPDDFKVEEISELGISKEKREYKAYLLEKKGIETFSLISYLSRRNRIPYKEFGIAGLKDRHAITKQHFTIPSKYSIGTLHEKDFGITPLGYTDKRLKLGDLKGNNFEIIVRDIKKGELEGISQKSKSIEAIGVPNYFDSQRFGSVIGNEFIAKHLIKRNYEKAVKIYLTAYTKFESSKAKQEKRLILQNWGNISKLKVKNSSLAAVIDEYKKNDSWLDAYKKITQNIREIIISAYQSYLWNECIKRILRKTVNKKKLYSIKYSLGSLTFYKNLDDAEIKKIPQTFKTISDEIKPSDFELGITNEVLQKEQIALEEFNIKKQTGNFFKAHDRNVLLNPSSFGMSSPSIDELNDRGKNNRFKIKLSFDLPKGSYATMITKKLFNQ